MKLETARKEARRWLDLIEQGVDPAEDEKRKQREKQERNADTFAVVVGEYIRRQVIGPAAYAATAATADRYVAAHADKKLTRLQALAKVIANGEAPRPRQRQAAVVIRELDREFVSKWGNRPITEITQRDVIKAVDSVVNRGCPAMARNLFGHVRTFFNWALGRAIYGLTASPCDRISPKALIGKKRSRNRILDDEELFALWRAAKRMRYPARPVYQLLMFTALRLNEVADARWPELNRDVARILRQRQNKSPIEWSKFQPEQLTWTIPEERMKGRNEEARPHMVPLTPDILTVLETLPQFKRGNFIFSTTFGSKAACIDDYIKKQIDARMLRTLKALERQRGDDPTQVELKPWVNHDIRRTVRSNLSRLRVTEEAREAVLAHVRPGIKQTYDLHDYFDEKREALQLWAARLRSIVEPTPRPDNVVPLKNFG